MTTAGDDATLRVPDSVPETVTAVGDGALTYETLEKRRVVGTGGNAVVHAASVGRDGPTVALKEPYERAVEDRTADRFVSEAETWAALDGHENVVDILDWGTDPHPWLALEYMDGGTLVDRVGTVSVEHGLWIGIRLAEALRHAHRHGVAHLDIKPSNVLFRECRAGAWDVPKVTDWGVSAVLIEDETSVEGLAPGYAAPEQFAPDRFGRPDDRTDGYQLGVVLYELLTGERPFEGATEAVTEATLEKSVPPPTTRDGTLPPSLDAVLGRALATRKEDRYASVVDLRRDLESLLADRCGYTPADDGRALDNHDEAGGTDQARQTEASETTGAYRATVELDSQGFVELSAAFFAGREPAPPARAVRTGLSFVDVHAGYAIERSVERDGERVDLTPHLLGRLSNGVEQAVVGPPDAGKSTLCKRVACAWLDADRGPVCYRESGATGTFDRPSVIGRWVRANADEGHRLIVIEDAVGEGSEAVFEAMRRFEGREDVTFLLEASEDGWRSPDAVGMDARLDAYRRGEVETVRLPRPDARECERLVEMVGELVDGPIAADPEQLVADLTPGREDDAEPNEGSTTTVSAERGDERDSLRPGTLQLLLHRLAERAEPVESGASATPTTFAESVQRAYADLQAAAEAADDERVLDVGLAANLCNAADIEVRPELLHAAALGPDPVERSDGQTEGTHVDVVGPAYDVLTDRLLFELDEEDRRAGEPSRRFRTAHAAWSVAFLAHAVERAGERVAHERFGRVLSAVLALADEPARRETVEWRLHGEAPYLDRVTADPAAWVRRLLAATFELGERRPKLAPLFGTTEYSRVSLPGCCPAETAVRRAYWRGRAYELAGRYDRAESEFREYERLAEERAADLDPETVAAARARARLHRGRVARMRGDYDRATEHLEDALERYETQSDDRGLAVALRNLGTVAWKCGDIETAERHLERSLDRYEAVGDEHGRARVWSELGTVAWFQDRPTESGRRYRRALEVYRETGDRRDEALCLNNLGIVARARDDLDLAEQRHRRGVECAREIGAERAEALNLTQLGRVLRRRGEGAAAVEYQQAAYEVYDRLGNRDHAANALLNLGVTEQVRGQFASAREYTQRALELKREVGDPSGRAHCLRNLAHVLQQEGRLNDAEARARRAVEVARTADDRAEEAACLVRLGAIEARCGEPEAALETLGSGLDLAVDTGSDGVRARALTAFGRVATERDAFVAAERHLRAALDIRQQEREADDREEAAVRQALGRLNRRRGDTERALTCFERVVELAADVGATHRAAVAAEAAAAVAETRGEERVERAWRERAARLKDDDP
jgi:tetratricopeptide (TPR) repeat protein